MTDEEVMAELRADTPLNRARKVLSGVAGAMEQAGAQRRPAGPIEFRRMEFEGVRQIVDALGLQMPDEAQPEANACDHDEGGSCALCPTDDQITTMRGRNRTLKEERRKALFAIIKANPSEWVHAVEARDNDGPDIVLHIASTLERARRWCEELGQRNYTGGVRCHIIPHRIDAPIDDKITGTVDIAVYGIRSGETRIEDLAGTDHEAVGS